VFLNDEEFLKILKKREKEEWGDDIYVDEIGVVVVVTVVIMIIVMLYVLIDQDR
jgi:hypothetical protein